MADDDGNDQTAGKRPHPGPVPSLCIAIGAAWSDREGVAAILARQDLRDVAVLLCLTHADLPDDQAIMATLADGLGRPLMPMDDGEAVRAGAVYLARDADIVTLANDHFTVTQSAGDGDAAGRIDSLLVSVGEAQRERAVIVVLAGAGGDGTLGATAIKEHGGLVIAERRTEGGPPKSVTIGAATSIADYVLPVEEIGDCLAEYERYLRQMRADDIADAERRRITVQLGQIATILRNRTGHDFHGYKQNTFMRRVQRRMQVRRCETADAYIEHLRDSKDEAQLLFNDMLIGVTQFFRDAREFETLEKEVVPRMFEGKSAVDSVRVWVLGCATGEEAYSLAILLREHMATMESPPEVQIFATDIDARALASARVGRFAGTIARHVSPQRLSRWFVREGETYSVVRELREMCIFSQHNLIKDAPFSKLDLISCRNLLIYLDLDLQNRVIPLFHFALLPDAYLFLGNSENVTRHSKLFAPIDRRCRIFRRIETGMRGLTDFPLTAIRSRSIPDITPVVTPQSENALSRRAERIAERHAPAYVIVDAQFDILHFSGRTGRYLNPSPGTATLNIMGLIHRDLRLDLRAALHRAIADRTIVMSPPIRMALSDQESRFVHIIVEPIDLAYGEYPSFVVLFRDGETVTESPDPEPAPSTIRDEHVRRLERDLRISRERLQSTIEELESTNEELKSSNEEYQSVNEELQSANEELETSKEELQSVNEELQTANSELANRIHDLGHVNSDLKNLLESTQIATAFLDNDLHVRGFTPALTEIFHLIDSDIGRPILHIAGRIDFQLLVDDVRRVMRTLTTIEREVSDPRSSTRYLARILPYRSVDNFIAGVVITFLDITATVEAEKALRLSEERFRTMARAVPIVLFTADAEFRFDYVNERFADLTGTTVAQAIGDGWMTAVHPDDIARVRDGWQVAASTHTMFEVECRMRAATGGFRWMMIRSDAIEEDESEVRRWSGSIMDIDALRMATEHQKILMGELQHRVKNILAVVRSIFSRTFDAGGSSTEMAEHFLGRMGALARTQTVVSRTPTGRVDLEELIRDELLSLGASDGPRVRIDGPAVLLQQKTAETISLAIHELATNATKYGALSARTGHLDVIWSVQPGSSGSRLLLEWQESGVPVVPTEPARSGFGRELIEHALPYQLGATTALEFAPGGVRCSINIPIAARPDSDEADDGTMV
ncbi:MAG TPA: CheR family methyltransferase [Sphingomonas sp.]|jgi:two-component system CheB/CheR fusion protein|uniref:CheR family methyltransferase n=1 Tax=Sphingomonas sp. TaxID=28214 RepID=UPI002ED84036